MIKTIKGDLIELALTGEFDIIAHGCNCYNQMGAGIALQIRKAFPGVLKADKAYKVAMEKIFGYNHPLHMVGNMSLYEISAEEMMYHNIPKFMIANFYTQIQPGPDFRMQEGLIPVLSKANLLFRGKKIGLPMIGAGIGGGDWKGIEYSIKALMGNCDVTIVEYQPKSL